MQNPLLVVLAAALAAWIFGAVYYGVLGKPWMRAQGLNPEDCKDKKMPLAPMAVSFAGVLVMAYVLQHLLIALGVVSWRHAMVIGLAIAIGFIASANLVNNMFQQRKLLLSVIDGAHWAGVVMIEAAVLTLLA